MLLECFFLIIGKMWQLLSYKNVFLLYTWVVFSLLIY